MVVESLYPISFRSNDAAKLGTFIKNRQAVAIIGMKRIGISNFLRFFLNHKEIIATYLDDKQKHLFISVDLNDLVEREVFPFWVLTLKRIYDTAEKLPLDEKTKKHIETLFLNSIQSQDLFLLIDNIRNALRMLIDAGFTPTIFFLRFDRIKDVINPEFFANLQGLKDALSNRLSYVFTSYRGFDFLAPHIFEKPSLTVFLRSMYLAPASSSDMKIIYDSYKKIYGTDFSEDLLNNLLELVNGYVRYLQLALLVLQEKKEILTKNALFDLLSFDERMTLQSEELWESFTEEEKSVLHALVHAGKIVQKSKEAWEYLINTGAIVEENGKYKIFSVLLNHFIKTQEHAKKEHGSSEFTKKEQLLFATLKTHVDSICEREIIIEAVWPEVEALGVSDWAIDRLVARVRNKLKLQKAKYEIQTVKTRGYKLVEI